MPRYTVRMKDLPDIHITADDVDGSSCSDSEGNNGAPYYNFWNKNGDDGSVTVAAIPAELVISIVS